MTSLPLSYVPKLSAAQLGPAGERSGSGALMRRLNALEPEQTEEELTAKRTSLRWLAAVLRGPS